MFSYKNASVGFTDSGKGKTIVLLHGFLSNRHMWSFFQSELSKKYRVVSIDLLGHGQTDSIGYVHSMEDQADLIASILDHLKLKKVVIVGHSMGGYVSLAFAEQFPERVLGLVLVNSTSLADSSEKKLNRDRAIKTVKLDRNAFVRLSVGNLFSERNREKFFNQIENIRQDALKTSLQGIIASLEGMKIRIDREVLLHFAPYSILLILGENDPVLGYKESMSQIEGTSVALVTFPDGHFSPVENQEELLTSIHSFLKKLTT